MAGSRTRVRVGGQELELSNLDKVLYPAAGFTKAEVIDYYTRVAPVLLPHLAGRALTRIRYPDGVDAPHFFEKNAPASTPDWVRLETLPAPGSSRGRARLDYVVVDDLPALVWVANLASLELHTPQWRIEALDSTESVAPARPDRLVMDLDPGPPAGLRECCEVALRLRDRLAADGLDAYPKLSGKKGMQLCCPIAATQSAADVSAYAKRIAEELAAETPQRVTSQMAKKLRAGKVFIDWSQNNAAKTTVSPYSLRAMPTPTVSVPLTWDEVESGAVTPADYPPEVVLARIDEYGDLMAPLLDGGPELPA
ncbi:MAG: non-homologous end-joining DNA ligase [Micromonosporaceae bacterium]